MNRRRLATVLLVAASVAADPVAAAEEPPPPYRPPACDNPLPQVLTLGLPYSEGLDLTSVEGSLRDVVGRIYRARALCPERPLRINAAFGSDYQILDWLDRGLVDMAVAPATAVYLLRRDGIDLIEVAEATAGKLESLVRRVPRLTLTWEEGGARWSRSGHEGDLVRFTDEVWRSEIEGDPERPAADRPVDRLVLPSHLSTAGFLMPVLEIEGALDSLDGAEEASADDRRRFWDAFSERVCFRFADGLGRRAGTACEAPAGGAVLEIATEADPGGRVQVGFGPPVLGPRLAYSDRLVIRRAVAEEAFRQGAFPEIELPPDDELRQLDALFERTVLDPPGREEVPLPTAFDGFRTADAHFGTRTFAFTVAESLDLIELHQRISGRSRLALVLPGGGVKAAYQSRILDELYGAGRLRNAHVVKERPGEVPPLRVDSVVGTSGGALLGFFVARLGAWGPWSLSDILWKPNGSGAGSRYLTSSEVFGWTDLPRYASLLLIFLVFLAVLGFCSLRRKGFLSPGQMPGEPPERRPTARPKLLLSLGAALVLTPFLLRSVSGPVAEEHVPEFEGLLYAILLVLAMFADQCLEWVEEEQEPARVGGAWVTPTALLLGGAALLGVPVALKLLGAVEWLEQGIGAGQAYAALGLVAAGLAMAAVRRPQRGTPRLREAGLWVLAFGAGSGLALLLLRSSSRTFLAWLDRTPLLFLALFAVLLVTAAARFAAGRSPTGGSGRISRGYSRIRSRLAGLAAGRGARTAAAVLVPLLACLIVLDLTRPEARAFLETPLLELASAPSKLLAPRGALAVCLGAILVSVGAIMGLHQRRNHYRFTGVEKFRDAVILVVVGLAFAVYAILILAVVAVGWVDERGWLAGSKLFAKVAQLTLFELTPAFWIGLVAVSGILSIAVVRWARAGRRHRGRVAAWLDGSLCYLCSVHPNGHLVPRRFIRLGALAIFGLVWWNFLLAPALYGNRYAVDYLEAADTRFDRAYCRSLGLSEAVCDDEERPPMSYELTARYLVPANALERDGTRFVLAVPGEEDCPTVPASPGVTWRRFHLLDHAPSPARKGGCEPLELAKAGERELLKDYVFASGSPFPAFPPRRVLVDRQRKTREALVDGGYSNNVPLEAAAKLGAEQALVVHSSYPAPRPGEGGWLSVLGGPLVDNLPRLVGFLYQRSQQLDRRSGSALFVVSLAPPYDPDWPLLTDFRSTTVGWMIRAAEEGLERRIGLVESWGPPRIQTSLEVLAPAPAQGEGGETAAKR